MDDLDAEYHLFKSLCAGKRVIYTDKNAKIIDKIRDKGIIILQVNNYFHLDESLIVLSETEIRSLLSSHNNEIIQSLEIVYKTNSTNKSICCSSSNKNFSVLLTELQTAGQGRRGKKWVSPLASNIYLSIQFQLKSLTNSHLIPLLTALNVCHALTKIGIEGCQIKWPNDIYVEGKKLAGILVDCRHNKYKGTDFIVGIGLNVNMEVNPDIDQSWNSLRNYKNKRFNRNIIISALLSETLATYNNLNEINMDKFKDDWQRHDFLFGSAINIIEENKIYSAVAYGIADDGALLIKHPESEILKKVYSADVSIRQVNSV